jgi:hypothetical protein
MTIKLWRWHDDFKNLFFFTACYQLMTVTIKFPNNVSAVEGTKARIQAASGSGGLIGGLLGMTLLLILAVIIVAFLVRKR